MRVAFGMLALLASTLSAPAEDNPACAKYDSPLAYNACLAKLGPKAGATRASPAPEEESSRAPHWTRWLSKRGRVEAVFPIAPKK